MRWRLPDNFLPSWFVVQVLGTLLIGATLLTAREDTPWAKPSRLPAGLTAREAEVLGLIAGGLSNSEIAAKLFIARQP